MVGDRRQRRNKRCIRGVVGHTPKCVGCKVPSPLTKGPGASFGTKSEATVQCPGDCGRGKIREEPTSVEASVGEMDGQMKNARIRNEADGSDRGKPKELLRYHDEAMTSASTWITKADWDAQIVKSLGFHAATCDG